MRTSPRFKRRALLAWAAIAATPCAKRAEASPQQDAFRHIDLTLSSGPYDARAARILLPNQLERRHRQRAVVLLHGYGAARSRRSALRAWAAHYGVESAYVDLLHPPLTPNHRGRLLSEIRREQINVELAQRPFGGMVLVCPRTPVPYGRPELGARYADWLVDSLLPAVDQAGSLRLREVGLAGVSMGGRLGLEVLAARPEAFAAFTGLQVHLERPEVSRWAARLANVASRVRPTRVSLITSDHDIYRAENEQLYQELEGAGVGRRLVLSHGHHNSEWLREVGSLELLLDQNRSLGAIREC